MRCLATREEGVVACCDHGAAGLAPDARFLYGPLRLRGRARIAGHATGIASANWHASRPGPECAHAQLSSSTWDRRRRIFIQIGKGGR